MGRSAYRVAAIDVGTNSVHMIVVETHRHGYRVIDREKDMVQLGRDSLEGKPLTDDAIERGVTTLKTMAEIARRWKVHETVAVATSAIREAPNRRRFLNAVEKASGIRVRVISGEEEADYIYRAVRSAVDFHDGTALCVDIGGGSVELIVGTDSEVFFTGSEPLGSLRIAQKYNLEGVSTAEAIDQARRAVRKAIKRTLSDIAALGFDFTIGTSGTIVSLAQMAAESSANGENEVASGLRWLSHARLHTLMEEFAAMSVDERMQRFEIDARRAQTIVAGAIVLDVIMEKLKIEQLRASDAAMREGIVEKALDAYRSKRESRPRSGSVRRSAVLALAERSDVDRTHSEHVARLALRIFDQTHALHMLRTGERELLEHAALLHEVGMHVSFQGHHKHSYYLISHAGLRGMTGDQVAIVANVARYYRKSPPDEGHRNFAELSRPQQGVIRKLASILRIADALDRSRRRAIRDVAIDVRKGLVEFVVRSRDNADVDFAAAAKKAKYFGRVFDTKVVFQMGTRGDV